MIVKMLTTAAGSEYVFSEGKEYEINTTIAEEFIKGGYAKEVKADADDSDKSKNNTANKRQPTR